MSNVESKSQKAYRIDKDLAQGRKLIEEGKKIDTALKLINKSARVGETKGKSYFEVANIIRLGLPGLDANPEESRTYYDAARENFSAEENKDGMDYRERGDYHYYGLGTHPADINQALEYYDLGAKDGDEASAKKAEEIRLLLKKGNSDQAPHLDENAQVVKDRETKPEEETAPAKEEKTEERQARKASAPIYFVKPKQACPIRSEGQPIKTEDKDINDVIDKEQKLRQALRILDSAASSRQDKLDAIALAKEASEEGSCRASVLLGYLYEGDNELIGKDFDKAKEFYEKAIGQGSVSALFRLGILYTDQDTSFYNPDKGHERIIESARKGYSWSLCYLGDCFREKVRDPRNLEVAYRYYALAGERGLGLGYHNRAEIDASRQQFELASQHEKSAFEHGYDPAKGYQDPVFYTLHL